MSELISAKIIDSTLYIYPCGRIDSSNATQAESLITEYKNNSAYSSVVVDAEKLEYISSAGLRVILRQRKEIPNLKIINANPDVYEIFDMTGFTEMIDIEKAYRTLSVEGCEVIGKGSNGEVYRLDSETIIKVYLNPDCLPDIQRERELARKAFVMGIPTAIPYDVVKVGDSYGSVFELLNAKSFTKILAADPAKIDEVAAMYVDLLKKIHSTQVSPDEIPNMKDAALKWVNDVKDYIKPEKWKKLYSLVENVPESYGMIHGDYHTKNLMVQNDEVLLIDMDTLCYGNPVFEFASIFNAYIGFYAGRPSVNGTLFVGIPYELGLELWNKTLRLYFNTSDKDFLKSAEEKAALIGYTRILRRTYRRCDISNPEVKNAIDFYTSSIESLTDKIDVLAL